jgi:hypothetical protein
MGTLQITGRAIGDALALSLSASLHAVLPGWRLFEEEIMRRHSVAKLATAAATVLAGVMAQDVQRVRPDAVTRGRDGYLRVFYDKLGLKFQTYKEWLASGVKVP